MRTLQMRKNLIRKRNMFNEINENTLYNYKGAISNESLNEWWNPFSKKSDKVINDIEAEAEELQASEETTDARPADVNDAMNIRKELREIIEKVAKLSDKNLFHGEATTKTKDEFLNSANLMIYALNGIIGRFNAAKKREENKQAEAKRKNAQNTSSTSRKPTQFTAFNRNRQRGSMGLASFRSRYNVNENIENPIFAKRQRDVMRNLRLNYKK